MVETPTKPRRRGGGGRAARIAVQQATTGNEAVHGGMQGGRYKPLSQRDMENIHSAALTVLERTGVSDHFPELLDLVLPKGAVLNEHGRLCFPRALMEDLLSVAAKEFYVFARGEREGKDDMHCTAESVYFANSGTAVTTFDYETRSYRPSTLRDVYDFTRLVDQLENIHMLGDTVLATDVTDDFAHDMNTVYAMLAGSQKPACLTFRDRSHIPHAIRMFDLASGGEGSFMKKPSVIFGGCPMVSPLRIGRENMELLIDTAKLGLTVDLAVPPQAGATAPATLAGTLVQTVAETLACVAIVNLITPGCPVCFAAWPFITDLRSGSFTGGSGEQALIGAAAVQMGNFYGLPTSVGAGMTDAKVPDAQYGLEKALTFSLAAHAGANRLCEFGGMIGSLMGCSFESMVIDDEAGGMILRTLRGIEVSDETMAVDVIHKCAIDPGHFLGNPHTLSYMNSEFVYPQLMDRERTDTWENEGKTDLLERAREKATRILDSHFPNYFGAADAQVRAEFPIVMTRAEMAVRHG
ncbi:trimethylamine methyltransferase family protein [Ruegeria pomeroyi]|uniref:Trimethylamine methyltransferase family protein n=1 Tax=Ruegeria pomeroyi TaxID=89184 RepID=A0A9Q3WMA6_9RHOB|nr:trimethylamine methyltransferase family protein [Ruegeria pomeroyi]MCE8515645.1 trimethylamine methyltransferase family protein [Ruegeria pomeroyi]MCE8538850.1 trimethylamine methyltransferase family protein [Ruegeria pomeroyi]